MNETPNAPQPSPASLLAGVEQRLARIAYPDGPPSYFDLNDRNNLARVVAMLDGAQRVAYDNYIWTMAGRGDDRAHPSDVMLAPAATHLAALVAATGAR